MRIGNQAVDQFQLDVYGEVMDALYQARTTGYSGGASTWALQKSLMRSCRSGGGNRTRESGRYAAGRSISPIRN